MATQTTPAHQEVLDTLHAWVRQMQKMDIPAIMEYYADDVVAYDAIQAIRFVGKAAYRKHYDASMGAMPAGSTMIFDLEPEPTAYVEGDLALVHYVCECGGSMGPGEPVQKAWMRISQGWRKQDGKWRIVHDHISQPFDMATNEVMFDAKP